jgi:prepilin-type N-terminal cleavage/methylation domain-containing protein
VKKGGAGFTLVEIMMVVMIVGVLALLAVPALVKVREESHLSRFENDLRQITGALERQAQDEGHFPPERAAGQQPAGITNYLSRLDWSAETPLGGFWDWDYEQSQFGCRAGVSVYRPDWTDDRMSAVDRRLDDGNLATGRFRKRTGGCIWIIEF